MRFLTILICIWPLTAAITSTTPSAFTGSDPTVIGGKFAQRATGPSPYPKALTINGTGAWTSVVTGTASGSLVLSTTTGIAPQTIYVYFNGSTNNAYTSGDKTANIAITGGITVNVSVTLTVVNRTCPSLSSMNTVFLNCTNSSVAYCDFDTCNPITNVRPSGSYTPPPIGGFTLDDQFGGFIRRVTGTGRFHPYSSVSPFNADGSLFMNFALGGVGYISNTITGAVVHSNIQYQAFIWDAYNKNVYYYIAGKTIRKVTLPGLSDVLWWTYPGIAVNISNGGTGDTSKDNWWAVYTDTDKTVCAVNLSNTTQAPCASYNFVPTMGSVDFAQIAKGTSISTGKRYIILEASQYNVIYQFTDTDSSLTFFNRMPIQNNAQYYSTNYGLTCTDAAALASPHQCFDSQHSDTVEIAGEQYLVWPFQDTPPFMQHVAYMKIASGDLMSTAVEAGGGMTLTLPVSSGNLGIDIGCAKKKDVCLITRYETLVASGGGTAASVPHQMELWIIRGLNIEARRVAEHRSIQYSDTSYGNYYDQPKGALSPLGDLAMFDSNYGILNGGSVYTVTTGVEAIVGGGVRKDGKVVDSGKVVTQ